MKINIIQIDWQRLVASGIFVAMLIILAACSSGDSSALFTATDPATVNLASGQIQFVEFFAFW